MKGNKPRVVTNILGHLGNNRQAHQVAAVSAYARGCFNSEFTHQHRQQKSGPKLPSVYREHNLSKLHFVGTDR